MNTQMFVNLPVKDLQKSIDFFTSLGFSFNQQFTNDKATCMITGTDHNVMLLVEEFFTGFTKKPVNDTSKTNEHTICLSAGSRAEVDDMVSRAVAAGASTYAEPQDHGFMYGHGFRDLDGHIWEFAWMDLKNAPAQQ